MEAIFPTRYAGPDHPLPCVQYSFYNGEVRRVGATVALSVKLRTLVTFEMVSNVLLDVAFARNKLPYRQHQSEHI